METQNTIANPEYNPVSVKEQLRQEIEQTPDEILAIAFFCSFSSPGLLTHQP